MRRQLFTETSISRLAEQGKRLAMEHRATLAGIERQFGVPANVVLAIWARETAYGTYKLPYNAVRVLATQAYIGKRKEKFSLKMLDPVEAMRLYAAALVALEERRGSGSAPAAENLPSASLAVSTAITFAFLA